jgi:hypothetical protein
VSEACWIRDADVAGWVALTKDERITRGPESQDVLARSHLWVFAIASQEAPDEVADLTGPIVHDERHFRTAAPSRLAVAHKRPSRPTWR